MSPRRLNPGVPAHADETDQCRAEQPDRGRNRQRRNFRRRLQIFGGVLALHGGEILSETELTPETVLDTATVFDLVEETRLGQIEAPGNRIGTAIVERAGSDIPRGPGGALNQIER